MRARDLTLRGLIDQFTQAIANIDGRLPRTFRYLISRPGFLTVAYLRGQRMPFVGPVQLFLISNVLFFATESLTHGKVFTTPLASHLHTQPWSGMVETLVANRVMALHTTVDLYSPVFDRAMAVNARSLIGFMALSFAPVLLVLFPRKGRPFVAHAVFSLHLYAFMLLLFCIATAIPPVERWFGGSGFDSEILDHTLAIGMLVACAIYLYFAAGTVYGTRSVARVLKVVALTVGVAGIILGYRFVLLLVTLYVT
jgi:hypothetical protein